MLTVKYKRKVFFKDSLFAFVGRLVANFFVEMKPSYVMYILLDCFEVHLICKRNIIWVEQPFLFLHYIITMVNYCVGERGLQWDYLLTTHTKYKYSFFRCSSSCPKNVASSDFWSSYETKGGRHIHQSRVLGQPRGIFCRQH